MVDDVQDLLGDLREAPTALLGGTSAPPAAPPPSVPAREAPFPPSPNPAGGPPPPPPPAPYPTRPTVTAAPISRNRIDECLDSAKYWAIRLPRYANEMQSRADGYAIAAAILSTITSLAIWGILTESSSWWTKALASAAALAAAAAAILPRVKNYPEAAGKARQLATQYGTIKGRLVDAQVWSSANIAEDTALRQVVEEFEAIKSGKDSLVPYPKRYINERHPEAKA
ncbi:hypothetical protein AB0M36_25445 [Actinoplanes sp. NPDC051346]|uniref:hypothetical protein n=1 Tax=Actinoplanes sp. NPDC051346 TaxID=3155048 RepID=UPI00342719ED